MINSVDAAIELLIKYKETVLEGYVSEYLFEKQFLDSSNREYAHGIWTAKWRDLNLFFIFKQELSDVDKKILSNKLLNLLFSCWHVYEKDNKFYFANENVTYDEKAFLISVGNASFSKKVSIDQDGLTARKKTCIDFFKNNNLLFPIATERQFVNSFLEVHFCSVINIDYIVLNRDGELLLYEVKFKDENYEGYFGINAGQKNLLGLLKVCGFRIICAVLYKDRLHSMLNIFDYINASDIPKKWYLANLDLNKDVKWRYVQKYTSLNRKWRQKVYYYDKNEILDKGECYELIIP